LRILESSKKLLAMAVGRFYPSRPSEVAHRAMALCQVARLRQFSLATAVSKPTDGPR
jgi:hypothetical protein